MRLVKSMDRTKPEIDFKEFNQNRKHLLCIANRLDGTKFLPKRVISSFYSDSNAIERSKNYVLFTFKNAFEMGEKSIGFSFPNRVFALCLNKASICIFI